MYDTLIIGSGPAGMTAGLYAARANLKVGIIEQGAPGGQMNNTSEIENYPGYDHISGPELSMKMHAPLEKFGVENIYGIVKSIEDAGDVKRVITEDATYEAKTIILATGAKNRALGVAGEEEYTSRGVSYCAVCDGAFFRNQDLLVIGGGDSAVEEAGEHEFGGIFIYVGVDPVSKMIEGLGITDEAGWVITDDHMKTAIPGIFAIGDVRKKELRQITTAVGDGAIAGQGVYQYIENMK